MPYRHFLLLSVMLLLAHSPGCDGGSREFPTTSDVDAEISDRVTPDLADARFHELDDRKEVDTPDVEVAEDLPTRDVEDAPGDVSDAPSYTPIAMVNEDDEQGVPLMLGHEVTIRGVVTVPTNVFSVENHELYVQDETGGVSVYEEERQSLVLELGDDVEVSGTVGQYNGKTEIDDPVFVLHNRDAPLPEPVQVTTEELCSQGESFEGRLIAIQGVEIVGGEAWPVVEQEGNFNMVIDDGTGRCAFRIDHQTELNGSPEPAQPFDVVGVVKQYDERPPYNSGYQVQPRYLSDITPSAR